MKGKIHNFKPGKRRMLLLTDGNFDQASARIRAIQYIPLFENAGFNVCFIPRVGIKKPSKLSIYFCFPLVKRYLWIKRMYALFFKSWDIIVIQRSFFPEYVLRKLKGKTPFIFDFDDAIYINERHPSNRKKAEIMIRYADEIIISSEFLNEFCSQFNKKGIVIPTPVETDRIKPGNKQAKKRLTIGWIGSTWTTQYLKVVEPVLERVNKEHPFIFLTVGGKDDFKLQTVSHINKKWSYDKENTFINEMDIGIMPLPDNEFTRAKGGYKLYLYMSAGIPCIASPVGVNTSIIRNRENGLLASTEDEWTEALKTLLTDQQLRIKMGQCGRNDAIEKYDRAVCYNNLMQRINRIIKPQ
jgi:glycosyltransferase involved in cell wall biosynthesis